ncbi:hypothetical protein [Blautia sp. MSJ-19]|uniref:hypothetical protein n=1 Tax=Blautia sp. MSJ-19 TaxID=2841517 RepID=UPI001C0ED323|nr:hypothetical protein [Blautia sp. MSJ-19]MBU5481716.1 hypothetical protein [Blautia sp. MSJ-19]
MNGQITIFEWMEHREHPKMAMGCEECYCKNCLFWWSSRCPYGDCWDDHRAKVKPFCKLFPDQTPRTLWSDWKKPGEQEHWCRGGTFYPERKCEHYVKYEGQTVEWCVRANISIFQDGYTMCTLKESIGCDACIAESEGRKINEYACEYMRDTGCERMFETKSLILDAIQEGDDIEPCMEQCCIGCTRTCGFRCGRKLKWN